MTSCIFEWIQWPSSDELLHRVKVVILNNQAKFFLLTRTELALAIQRSGYDLLIMTPPAPETKKIEDLGLRNRIYPLNRKGLNPLQELRSVFRIYQALREEKPDILHLYTVKPIIYGGLAARWLRIPKVVCSITGLGHVFTDTGTLMSIVRPLVVQLYKFVFRGSQFRIVFQNPDDRDTFVKLGIVDFKKTFLVPGSGVNLEQFSIAPEPNSKPRVVVPARLLWTKGIREFIEAARELKNRKIEADFVLVGDTDEDNYSSIPKTEIMNWVDEGLVQWEGYKTDMAAEFQKAAVVCLPSYREGVPRAILEAMACGRPIVTTDAPGCKETIREGLNGIAVPVKDSKALSDALEKLILEPSLRAKMGRESRRYAEERFSVQTVISKFLDIYSS